MGGRSGEVYLRRVRKWMAVCLHSLAGRELMLFFLIHALGKQHGGGTERERVGGGREERRGGFCLGRSFPT